MVIRGYHDAGNQPDSTQYPVLTLAGVYGTKGPWRKLEKEWKNNLVKHGAPWLHTTDAVGLRKDFSKSRGWTKTRVEAFIEDCVKIIERHSSKMDRSNNLILSGLRPCTITVDLKDYKRLQDEGRNIGSFGDMVSAQCLVYGFTWGRIQGADDRYELFYDQGEPYGSHTLERWKNPVTRKHVKVLSKIDQVSYLDMRRTPGLQVADLFAWSVNSAIQYGKLSYKWQGKLLDIPRDKDILHYQEMLNTLPGTSDKISSWKLQDRKKVK